MLTVLTVLLVFPLPLPTLSAASPRVFCQAVRNARSHASTRNALIDFSMYWVRDNVWLRTPPLPM